MNEYSRLERFLKALCSLDYSDLPTPLSRVEVLWNCLITGEAIPDFQPQSRTEKYLMYILGVYDLEDIPQPISRSEVLLYKLATGDTDVDLEDRSKSRYERLLSEIVANGGVGGNVDFEYVTNILTGSSNTLYNTVEKPVESATLKGKTLKNLAPADREVTLTGGSASWKTYGTLSENLEPSTKYIMFGSVILNTIDDENAVTMLLRQIGTGGSTQYVYIKDSLTKKGYFIFTVASDKQNVDTIQFYATSSATSGTYKINKLMIIKYQEGMENWDIPYFEGMQSVKMPVLTTSNEDGTKTNILTVNEPVELRGIGEVKDELDLVTGEVTRRISEIVLDGSDDLAYNREAHSNDTTTMVHVPLPNTNRNFDFYNDKLPQKHIYDITNVTEGVFSDWGGLFVRLLNSKLSSPDSNGVKEYLQSKPITVQYQLATESVKTIDISTVDQDGNNTELSTFNDITHVTLSSEGLIPEAELEVATKNEEVLNTMSLKMDDISAAQTTLKETSNTQSENVDATMIATTEIYEGLL